MRVLKFGGSVLKNEDDILNIENIVKKTIKEIKNNDKIVLVFSAFYGITNKLLSLGLLSAKKEDFKKQFDELKNFHIEIATKLGLKNEDFEIIKKLFTKIENTLNIINDKEILNNENTDYLLAFGERLSNFIIASFLSKTFSVKQISPCSIIKTDSNFGYASVNFEESNSKIKDTINNIEENIIVCAGFFGSDKQDRITTLGRNGSDYSASIIAGAIKAERLEIWKDIDGLYTADPKIVKNVKIIKKITYQEMAELSSLGNKVIHINAISPCILSNIPIVLKNCYNHDCEGTYITKEKCENYLINGIVKYDGVSIITLQANEFADITDIAIKLQVLIKDYNDTIITISQSIKQKKISLMVSNLRFDNLYMEIKNIFKDLIEKQVLELENSSKMSLITIIGANLSAVVGISGKIFRTLENNNINVFAIQDDFSTTRISFLCNTENSKDAVNLLHNELLK